MDHFDVAIIGTGSGNTILDERYAGKRIAICERGAFGGTCINVGCIPTKMFAYAADIAHSPENHHDSVSTRMSMPSAGTTSSREYSAASTHWRSAASNIGVPRPT